MGAYKILFGLILCTFSWVYTTGQGSVRDKVSSVYVSQIGVKETWGNNAGPEIRMYQESCGFPNQSVAWCACFVSWVYKFCGLDIPDQHPALAAAWFPKNKTTYRKQQPATVQIKRGDVIGFYFPHLKRIAHAGFFHAINRNGIVISVEGNTNDASLEREGDRVMVKKRFLNTIDVISNWIDQPEVSCVKYHIMRPGQTLYRLSVWYGISVDQIMEWNGLRGSDVKVGQRIRVK